MSKKIQSRQVRRRLAREEAHNPIYFEFKGDSRNYRRHMYDTKNDVVNQRCNTVGRDIINQHIYNIMDTEGIKILSFGSTNSTMTKNMLPKKIKDRIYKICFDKKKEKQTREMNSILHINTIKHIRPSQNDIRYQKFIIEQTLKKG